MVYRQSEADLAGAVSTAAGNVEAMISAAKLFWVAPATSEFSDELDDSTWAILVKAQAGEAAITALLGLAEEKTIRYRTFLHLVQDLHLLRGTEEPPVILHSSEVKLLVALLPRMREEDQFFEHWAAILVRLVEGGAIVEVRKHLEEHQEELRLDDKKWALVALLLATTSIRFVRVDQWLADWESRKSVAMFLVCLYLDWAEDADPDGKDSEMRVSVASRALQALEADGSEHYLRCVMMGGLLRARQHDEFLRTIDDNEELLKQSDEDRPLRHPLGQALNRYKTRYRLVDADFQYHSADTRGAGVFIAAFQGREEVNQRIVNSCRDLGRYEFIASQAFLKVRELLQIEKKSKRIVPLAREFRSLRKPAALRWINGEWDVLFRKRARLTARLAMTLS